MTDASTMCKIQIPNTQLYASHVTSTFIPDVVTTPPALHVMEDGCLAAPERGVSRSKNKFIHVKKE